ncbi:MAG: chromosome partitioning protein ParB [Rhodobacterales bacterium 65-51]|uniref:ParB/RepB/Spo0J family partition protein n=1 Tax=uncultured Gemmobacter sp. TaxID=1095917 RepID=UPI000969CFA9|nr:ParB/RepB/Spo0J family partition protein [uncultured Gemmobacter sp.]OJY33023.1 MAG: chromosome partitioning protein ParB [Rhodobacterales bacterium 65-51]
MEKKVERRGLGRGLSALMADVSVSNPQEVPGTARKPDVLPIEAIKPNPDQPRRSFTDGDLEDLAASIRQKGVLQPLIVRPVEAGYEIVAGERRWRAAQLANLHQLPVLIRDFDDTEVLEIAIIENIQREDLNAIEEALAFRQLMDRFGHTQEKLAEALSKSRSYIANLLRLLNLPEDVQRHVRDGRLSAGHARALVTHSDASAIAQEVIAKGLSVRETEELVRKVGAPARTRRSAQAGASEKDADTRALELDLSANLGMGVTIAHGVDGEGTLSIRYRSLDELDLLCQTLSVMRRDVSI